MGIEQAPTEQHPVMFHYLFQLHQNGVVLGGLEINVPTGAFTAVRMNGLLSLEAMLRDYGLQMGWKLRPAPVEKERSCDGCSGDGYFLPTADGYLIGDAPLGVRITCTACSGTGKVPVLGPREPCPVSAP